MAAASTAARGSRSRWCGACARCVGAGFPILCKTNLRDGFRGGLEVPDAVGLAQRLEREGVDALVLSGGFTSRTPFYLFRGRRPLAEMIEVEKCRLQKLALAWFGRSRDPRVPLRGDVLPARGARGATRGAHAARAARRDRVARERGPRDGGGLRLRRDGPRADRGSGPREPDARRTRTRARAARTATSASPRWTAAACAACSGSMRAPGVSSASACALAARRARHALPAT